jgi:hypothetical protein
VSDAIRLPDDRIVILNSGVAEMQFYAADGTHLRTVGTQGEGPGEFQHPEWVTLLTDTLIVFDPFQDNGRISLFDLEGDFIRSERVDAPGLRFPTPDFVLTDGHYLDQMSEGSIGLDEEGHVVYTRYVIRYSRTGSPPDTLIHDVPGSELYREKFGNGMSQLSFPTSMTHL